MQHRRRIMGYATPEALLPRMASSTAIGCASLPHHDRRYRQEFTPNDRRARARDRRSMHGRGALWARADRAARTQRAEGLFFRRF
jgi:hypothetical protein